MKSNYYIELSDKFKTNFLQVRYLIDANKENITKSSLLAMYLVYCNNVDRTYKQANDRLDALYGSKFDVVVGLSGNHLVFNFVLSFVATKYLKNEDTYLNEIMNTYLNYIFNPYLEDGVFNEEVFELKKYELKERIKQSYDDKTTYALEEFLSLFGKNHPLALNSNGYLEDIDTITSADLTTFYHEMISDVALVNGNVTFNDYKEIEDILKTKIKETNYTKSFEWYLLENNEIEEKIEKQAIAQSKLVVGYTYGRILEFTDYYNALILNALLGMSSNSYLFRIVREKENLCYTIRSNYDIYSNSILIYAGIEKENYSLAISLIEKIIVDLQSSAITEEDFADAKIVMIDVINKVNDGQGGLVGYQANRYLQGNTTSLEDDIKGINNVKISDVVSLAQELKLKTKYLLSGELNG